MPSSRPDPSIYDLAASWVSNGLDASEGALLNEPPAPEPGPTYPDPLPHSAASSERLCPLFPSDESTRKRNFELAIGSQLSSTSEGASGAPPSPASLLGSHVKRFRAQREWYEKRRMHRLDRYRPRYIVYLPSTAAPHSARIRATLAAQEAAAPKTNSGVDTSEVPVQPYVG